MTLDLASCPSRDVCDDITLLHSIVPWILPNVHPTCAWASRIGNIVFVFLCSYSQDELVAGAISSAAYNHPSLKELTTGDNGYGCPSSLANGAVKGIVRKAGVKKLVVEDDFPGEL